jgi:hypothetical protein
MPVEALTIKVATPAGSIPHGRGFYQLEEEELYLPIKYSLPGRERFFSYLDSETASLHLDRQGRLIFIEITLPRRRWRVKENLVVPEKAEAADIRFLDFRDSFPTPSIFCDLDRRNLMILFRCGPASHNYYLAENLIAQIDSDNKLIAVWVSDMIDDLAGREIATWRKLVRSKQVRATAAFHYSSQRM